MRDAMREKDKTVLDYIADYFDRNGYAPAIRDICRDVQIKSTATAHAVLQRLANAGYIRISPNLKRTIELTNRPSVRNVPLVGTIAAGQPILASENIDGVYPLPTEIFGRGELFMLKVKGESMIEAGIFDGDSIVVRQQETADNGQMVAALVEESATVKYYYRENGGFRLQPANAAMQPLIYDDVKILGIVVGLMRKI